MSIVSIAVEMKSMAADGVTKWKHVDNEKNGAKD